MPVVIPDDVIQAAGWSADELRCEIALLLYQQRKLSLPRAAWFAGLDRVEFHELLAARQIPLTYDAGDVAADVATLTALPRS